MARRTSSNQLLLGIAYVLAAIWILVKLLQSPTFFLLLILGIAIWFGWRTFSRKTIQSSFQDVVGAVIVQHIDSLVRRHAQLVWRDPYGKLKTDKWEKEIEGFINDHIAPALTGRDQRLLESKRVEVADLINRRVGAVAQSQPAYRSFSNTMSPREFEIFCAEQLRQIGWDARVTLESRDQGIDVVATKTGLRVVLQCKLYAGPVGNKAVQEIAAGRAHEQAHYGIVVTNSRYTSSAEQLAATNRILLLHYRDLTNLDGLISNPGIVTNILRP